METSLLKKYSLSSICNVIVCSLIIVGCHVDSQKQSKLNDSESLDTENSESLSDEGLNNEVSPQNVQKIIDAITKTLMPLASDKDKEEINKFPRKVQEGRTSIANRMQCLSDPFAKEW